MRGTNAGTEQASNLGDSIGQGIERGGQLIEEHHKARQFDAADRVLWRMSIVVKVLLSIAIFSSVVAGDLFLTVSGAVALLFMFVPAVIERSALVTLPVELDAFVTIFLFVHFVLGEVNGYYHRIPWFDIALHWTSGFVIALLGFLIIYTFLSMNKVQAKPVFIFLFTISLAMGIGATWEIYEFTMDQLFGWNMQKSGIVDTMWDLIATLIGAIVVSFFGYRYLKNRQKRGGLIHRLAKKLLRPTARQDK